MKATLLPVLIVTLLALASSPLRAAEEQDLIATLRSNAGAPQKWAACQRLRIIGSAQAVPALAPLLTEERTSQAARHALEGLPYPEAGAALREALGKTSGLLRVGVVDSLGWRGEIAAVPLLKPLLSNTDITLASSVAAALGRIGGSEAIAALSGAREDSPAAVQVVITESLLKCAERLLANNDSPAAANLYREVFESRPPTALRRAAWRGLALADTAGRNRLVLSALTGQDRPIQATALKVLRELGDRGLIDACARQWNALSPEAQMAVLDAQVQLGSEALPTARLAGQSSDVTLRTAAWQACGQLNDVQSVPALVRAAAGNEPTERETARDVLTRLRGAGAREALLATLEAGTPPEKAEVLRALGERGDRAALNVLLQNASSDLPAVRLAALDSVRRLAPPQAITPLLEIAARSRSDEEREPVLKALFAVTEASPDKGQTARSIVDSLDRFPANERRQILPLLSDLGTPEALAAAEKASRDPNTDLAKEAVRVLSQWPNATPATHLIQLARSNPDLTFKTLALRGAIEVSGQETDPVKRFALLQQAFTTAQSTEEKRQALGQMGQVPSQEALNLVVKHLPDPELGSEAALAAIGIAEKLAPTNPKLGDEVASQVLTQVKEGDVARRAWALRLKPSSAESFIRDWMVCGPYRQAGLVGALAVFNIPFGPEKSGQAVEWKSVPPGDQVNLAGFFPGAENCVAYLRTHVIAPQDTSGVLLTGSDDGIKAWLNGVLVHSNNVDRGQAVDQDSAPIRLKKGANELVLKITQGGGGWSACARILGADGKPIPGLLVERPTGPAQPLRSTGVQATDKPVSATLPPRDTYRTLHLSEQFYAEGAYFGDFNRDGKPDVVAGPFWFQGPEFRERFEYRPVKAFDPKDYSDNFLTYTGDFNADGWTDILCVPFPGAEGFWYENPKGSAGFWKKHLAYSNIGNESPMWGDVNGDGQPELVFNNDGYLGYAGPNPAKPEEPWVFHAVSKQDKRYQRFTHGVGFGDLNGDGRVDLLESMGWWEQPSQINLGASWIFHPFKFADDAAQMLVYDVDGDGLADVITTWHCHLYGLVWWQQLRGNGSEPDWRKHVILSPTPDPSSPDFRVSQMHALELVDLNGDGLKDIVTGKRFWAHGPTGDKEPDAPPVLFWLELRRDSRREASYLPHLIDENSGVGTQVAATDLNGDGRPDIVVGNKKGVFVHLSERPTVP